MCVCAGQIGRQRERERETDQYVLLYMNVKANTALIATIRITSVRWRSYLPKTQKLVLIDPAFAVPRFESRNWVFIRATFVPRAIVERLAGVDCVPQMLAIGGWRFHPSKIGSNNYSPFSY